MLEPDVSVESFSEEAGGEGREEDEKEGPDTVVLMQSLRMSLDEEKKQSALRAEELVQEQMKSASLEELLKQYQDGTTSTR